jgi:hypothetical protein
MFVQGLCYTAQHGYLLGAVLVVWKARVECAVFFQDGCQLIYIQWRLFRFWPQRFVFFRCWSEQGACRRCGLFWLDTLLGWVLGGFFQRLAEKGSGLPVGSLAVPHDLFQHPGRQAGCPVKQGLKEVIGGLCVVQRPMCLFQLNP